MLSTDGAVMKKCGADDDAPFDLVAGLVAIVVAALAAAALFPGADPAGRLVMMAVVAGVLAGWVKDGRVAVAVVAAACLIYVGFLTHHYGELVGDPTPWRQTVWLIGAGVAGRGVAPARRALRRVPRQSRQQIPRRRSEPIASFEGAVQGHAGGDHQDDGERVSDAPVQLGHVVKVHPVHGGDQ